MPFEMRVLGSFEIRRAGRRVRLPKQERRILAFLALERRRVTRARVIDTLWPATDGDHAAGNLRSAIWRLRQVDPDLVMTGDDEVGIGPQLALDLTTADRLAHDLVGGAGARTDPGAVAALSDDVLPDWDEPWVEIERERFRQLRLHALESLGRRLVIEGRFAEAVEAGLRTVLADPLRETAHRLLIEVHLAEGNRASAVRQYRTIEQTLRDELDISPDPETSALVHDLL